MYVNETLCFDEQDLNNTIEVMKQEGFAYSVVGMTIYFWS